MSKIIYEGRVADFPIISTATLEFDFLVFSILCENESRILLIWYWIDVYVVDDGLMAGFGTPFQR